MPARDDTPPHATTPHATPSMISPAARTLRFAAQLGTPRSIVTPRTNALQRSVARALSTQLMRRFAVADALASTANVGLTRGMRAQRSFVWLAARQKHLSLGEEAAPRDDAAAPRWENTAALLGSARPAVQRAMSTQRGQAALPLLQRTPHLATPTAQSASPLVQAQAPIQDATASASHRAAPATLLLRRMSGAAGQVKQSVLPLLQRASNFAAPATRLAPRGADAAPPQHATAALLHHSAAAAPSRLSRASDLATTAARSTQLQAYAVALPLLQRASRVPPHTSIHSPAASVLHRPTGTSRWLSRASNLAVRTAQSASLYAAALPSLRRMSLVPPHTSTQHPTASVLHRAARASADTSPLVRRSTLFIGTASTVGQPPHVTRAAIRERALVQPVRSATPQRWHAMSPVQSTTNRAEASLPLLHAVRSAPADAAPQVAALATTTLPPAARAGQSAPYRTQPALALQRAASREHGAFTAPASLAAATARGMVQQRVARAQFRPAMARADRTAQRLQRAVAHMQFQQHMLPALHTATNAGWPATTQPFVQRHAGPASAPAANIMLPAEWQRTSLRRADARSTPAPHVHTTAAFRHAVSLVRQPARALSAALMRHGNGEPSTQRAQTVPALIASMPRTPAPTQASRMALHRHLAAAPAPTLVIRHGRGGQAMNSTALRAANAPLVATLAQPQRTNATVQRQSFVASGSAIGGRTGVPAYVRAGAAAWSAPFLSTIARRFAADPRAPAAETAHASPPRVRAPLGQRAPAGAMLAAVQRTGSAAPTHSAARMRAAGTLRLADRVVGSSGGGARGVAAPWLARSAPAHRRSSAGTADSATLALAQPPRNGTPISSASRATNATARAVVQRWLEQAAPRRATRPTEQPAPKASATVAQRAQRLALPGVLTLVQPTRHRAATQAVAGNGTAANEQRAPTESANVVRAPSQRTLARRAASAMQRAVPLRAPDLMQRTQSTRAQPFSSTTVLRQHAAPPTSAATQPQAAWQSGPAAARQQPLSMLQPQRRAPTDERTNGVVLRQSSSVPRQQAAQRVQGTRANSLLNSGFAPVTGSDTALVQPFRAVSTTGAKSTRALLRQPAHAPRTAAASAVLRQTLHMPQHAATHRAGSVAQAGSVGVAQRHQATTTRTALTFVQPWRSSAPDAGHARSTGSPASSRAWTQAVQRATDAPYHQATAHSAVLGAHALQSAAVRQPLLSSQPLAGVLRRLPVEQPFTAAMQRTSMLHRSPASAPAALPSTSGFAPAQFVAAAPAARQPADAAVSASTHATAPRGYAVHSAAAQRAPVQRTAPDALAGGPLPFRAFSGMPQLMQRATRDAAPALPQASKQPTFIDQLPSLRRVARSAASITTQPVVARYVANAGSRMFDSPCAPTPNPSPKMEEGSRSRSHMARTREMQRRSFSPAALPLMQRQSRSSTPGQFSAAQPAQPAALQRAAFQPATQPLMQRQSPTSTSQPARTPALQRTAFQPAMRADMRVFAQPATDSQPASRGSAVAVQRSSNDLALPHVQPTAQAGHAPFGAGRRMDAAPAPLPLVQRSTQTAALDAVDSTQPGAVGTVLQRTQRADTRADLPRALLRPVGPRAPDAAAPVQRQQRSTTETHADEAADESTINIEALAQQVYARLRRRLAVEAERAGHR